MTNTSRWVLLLSLAAFGAGCGSDASADDGDDAALGANGGSANASGASGASGRVAAGASAAVPGSANAPAGAAAPAGASASGALPASDPRATPDDVAAAPADAEVTPSGLASKVLRPGTGTLHPAAVDKVTVQYSGWTTDGKLFDSSYNRNTPASFPLNGVIAGWTEGLQLMVEGEIRRFWIPQDLAYGANPAANKPRGALTFDVELLEIAGAP